MADNDDVTDFKQNGHALKKQKKTNLEQHISIKSTVNTILLHLFSVALALNKNHVYFSCENPLKYFIWPLTFLCLKWNALRVQKYQAF